ncbi:ornithine cyclodeaminase family protein [Rhodococcus jostii]|uniref:Ornithine cyclodeaminase family protein n=1 Tax=Rhodococcus jostii TaxID=132919 RepID=A0ABU4CR87_RHOJO|nr:ornithine cyclodeaminase family protein [Rhodococcus jostii]MDV6286091.1 ornithine cyclodeaminase family protein [Rhodococcus jostii]
MTLLLDDAAVQSAFDWAPAIAALRDAYAAAPDDARFPARTIARGGTSFLRLMSGAPGSGGLMGVKTIAGAIGVRQFSYLISLFDQESAELVALLDGNSITGYRTAATSALAVDLLAAPGPVTVAVIGSGFEAKKHVRALAAVRKLEAVRVYSPRAESRARFADELADLDTSIIAAESPQAAVANASVVICAARSYDESPILLGAWLEPGMTVVSIGSTVREQREVDPEVIARADVVIADVLEEVLHDSGDLIAATQAGIDVTDRIAALSDLVSGTHPGRTTTEQIVVYKSVGSAVQDLAVAAMCADAARKSGLGSELPIRIPPVHK